jgi:hypothetical protein
MSLARKVIERRRKQSAYPEKIALGAGVSARNKTAWNDTGERLDGPSDAPQRWGTHGHKISEKASDMHRKHMVENREAKTQGHTRKRRTIRGGTHGNEYMPPETRGEL